MKNFCIFLAKRTRFAFHVSLNYKFIYPCMNTLICSLWFCQIQNCLDTNVVVRVCNHPMVCFEFDYIYLLFYLFVSNVFYMYVSFFFAQYLLNSKIYAGV